MRSPSLVFTRRIHALHDLFTKTPTGRLAKLTRKALPPLEKDVRLQDSKGKMIATVSSIDSLVSHLEPFSYLKQPALDKPLYRITQLMKFPSTKKTPPKFKRAGTGKEIHLTTTCLPGTWTHRVSKAYEFLSKGWRVEFHVRPKVGNNVQTLDWALQNALHMRPEVISAAMPEGTQVLMPPVQDGTALLWVLDHEENRLKAGGSRKGPTKSAMPIGTLSAKSRLKGAEAAGTQENIAEPSYKKVEDRRSPTDKSSDAQKLKAHRNAQAENEVDRENPESPSVKSSRESVPRMVHYSQAQANLETKKVSLPHLKTSHETASTQVHYVPAEGNMEMNANTSSNPKGSSDATATAAQNNVPVTTDVDVEGSSASHSELSSKTAPDVEHKSISDIEHSTQPVKVGEPLESFIRHTWKRNEAGEPQEAFSRRKLDMD